MIPKAAIVLVDAVGAAALLAALFVALLRRQRVYRGAVRVLLVSLIVVSAFEGVANLLEWSEVMPEADLAEDFVNPLGPVLWLFMFLVAIERSDRDRLRREFDRTDTVHQLAAKLTVTMEPRAIMDEAVSAAARLLDLPLAAVFTPEADGQRLLARAAHGLAAQELEDLVIAVGEGPTGRALRQRHPSFANDSPDDLAPAARPLARRHHVTNVVAVPLLVGSEAVGVLTAARGGHRPFGDDEVHLLETLCAHAAVAIQNARLYERLAESEAKYRVLVENAQIAIIVVDAYRHILFWNRGAERLFGWSADEVLSRHVEFIYPEDHRADVLQTILPALQREGVWSGEYPLVRKDGTPFSGFLSLSRIFDAQGNVICTLGVASDVTERIQLREQLFQAQKMETLGALAGGIAHDFGNLLTAILGSAGLLRDAAASGSESHESAVAIEQAARRGADLVRQLMAVSQRQPTRPERVDLSAIVRDAANLLRRTFPKTIDLVVRADDDLRPVLVDATQLHQVLMNLTVNARDAMPDGGTLTLATENLYLDSDDPLADGLKAGPCVVLTVSDTGCGIASEARSRIFEPFYTTKRDRGGTGLGLSTVYAIVTRHGGRIDLDSRPGEGTRFRIILPAAR